MTGFLKVFVRGLICTVLLPVILAVWVLWGVYCLFAFLYMLVKSIILFFMGENPTGELKEDIEAKKMLLEAEQEAANRARAESLLIQNAVAQQQMLGQAMMQAGLGQQGPQPAIFPQPAPSNDFDPFTPDPVEAIPFEENNETESSSLDIEQPNKEGGSDNDESC